MKVRDLTAYLEHYDECVCVSGNPEAEFSEVLNHAGKTAPDNLFAAVKGSVSDGHNYIMQAVEKGASVILHTEPLSGELPVHVCAVRVRDGYRAFALSCEFALQKPADRLTLCAVTGTNGKTTTAFWIRQLLTLNAHKTALLSTVFYDDGSGAVEADRTTPSADAVQHAFAAAVKNGCSHLVMEQSSHGLSQSRTGSAAFKAAVFTNLTGDHLDYHGTMENYFAAKTTLFLDHLSDDGYAVINTDDPYGKRLAQLCTEKKIITFGQNPHSEWRIILRELVLNGSRFTLQTPEGDLEFDIPAIGEYNVYNFCGAAAAAYSLGMPLSRIRETAPYLTAVPGRMESFALSSGARAFVDYAHTDDALIRAMKALRAVSSNGKLIVLFGCGGDRDKTKRPRMGEAAATLADTVILTSDNPRSEVPERIIDDMKCGITVSYANKVHIEPDRAKAIALALSLSTPGDAVLIAGKGHETYQEVRGVKHPFDDRSFFRKG